MLNGHSRLRTSSKVINCMIRYSRQLLQADGYLAAAGRRLLAEVARDCHADESTLWLIAEDGRHLEGALNHGRTPQLLERATVALVDSVVGMVASTGIATAVGRDDQINTTVDQQTGTPTRAMIAAPVLVGDDPAGVLSAINPKEGRLFDAQALETLQWKAYLMGLILGQRNA